MAIQKKTAATRVTMVLPLLNNRDNVSVLTIVQPVNGRLLPIGGSGIINDVSDFVSPVIAIFWLPYPVCCKITTAFWPPSPKELLKAVFTASLRGSLGV